MYFDKVFAICRLALHLQIGITLSDERSEERRVTSGLLQNEPTSLYVLQA